MICLTNSNIPPSYLCSNSFAFFEVLSINLIEIPLFRKANSLILFSRIEVLNLIDEKICFEGKNVILVPFFFVLPNFLRGLTELPSLNLISYSLPSLKIFKSNFSDNALTTDTPTPCKPPETLYESWSNLPPACNWVIITSAADIFSPLCMSTGIPLPSSSIVTVLSELIETLMFLQ